MTIEEYKEHCESHDWDFQRQDAGLVYFKRERAHRELIKKIATEKGGEYQEMFNQYLKKYGN